MVHTHKPKGLKLQLESRVVTDCLTDQVVSVENRQTTPEPKVEYHSLEEAKKMPILRLTFNVMSRLFEKAKSSNCLLRWTLEPLETLAFLVGRILLVTLGAPLLLVDGVLTRLLIWGRDTFPTLNKSPDDVLAGFKDWLAETRQAVYTRCVTILPKLIAVGTLRLFLIHAFCILANNVHACLQRVEHLVDSYFPIEPALTSSETSSHNTSGSSSSESQDNQQADDGDVQ